VNEKHKRFLGIRSGFVAFDASYLRFQAATPAQLEHFPFEMNAIRSEEIEFHHEAILGALGISRPTDRSYLPTSQQESQLRQSPDPPWFRGE
jgi:hypothetical protein